MNLWGLTGVRCFFRLGWNSDGEVLAHFVEAFFAESANGQQIIDAFERPVRLAHL